MIRGSAIRERREALGLTLEQVALATRIPVAHLAALEDERAQDLPAGPYALAYTRAVCRVLDPESSTSRPADLDAGSSEGGPPPLPATPPQGAPLWAVRAMAGTSVVALALLLGSFAFERVRPALPALPLTGAPPQTVAVVARRPTRLVVSVDGAEVLNRQVGAGESLSFAGRDTIEVRVAAISDVRLDWNGVAVVPQGRVDAPRTLRFVDDGVPW